MRAKLCLSLVAFGQLCAVATAQKQPAAVISPSGVGSATYITHVTVIDTETGKKIQDRTVIISGDRISEVKDSKGMSKHLNIPVEGHLPNQIGAWEASEAKQKSFEHLLGIPVACSDREEEIQPKIIAAPSSKGVAEGLSAVSQAYRADLFGSATEVAAMITPKPFAGRVAGAVQADKP